jgi:signal transduction histidine kinase
VRTKPGVELHVVCPPGLAVLTDRDLAGQAVFNLVENAASHTEEGRIALSASADGPTVQIRVEDTGTGIAPEERARVFDRFYRGDGRTQEGFGLGLAIVRQAVRALGGTIEIESAPGLGTTARVMLPAVGADRAS